MIELPFNSSDFAEAWTDWMEYKKRVHNDEYTPRGLKLVFKRLFRYSHGIEEIAIAIIEQSLETEGSKKPWKGFFPLDYKDPLMVELRKKQSSNKKETFQQHIMK